MVLPEELCDRLGRLAERDARTMSNMARVLIQQGVERLEQQHRQALVEQRLGLRADGRGRLEAPRLRGLPRRLRQPRQP